MSEGPRERIGGTIGGQKFAIETQHLISVLLIIVVAVVIYFLVNVQQQRTEALIDSLRDDHDKMSQALRDDHDQMFARMTVLGNALRVVDWNQNRPVADRVPIDLPSHLFEDYRRQAAPEDERRMRPRTPSPGGSSGPRSTVPPARRDMPPQPP